MKTPDDVPTGLTKRAYGLKGISQNMYAAVVADAYEAIRVHVLTEEAALLAKAGFVQAAGFLSGGITDESA